VLTRASATLEPDSGAVDLPGTPKGDEAAASKSQQLLNGGVRNAVKVALSLVALKLIYAANRMYFPALSVGALALKLGLDWRPFVAGGLSAAWSHGIATPFDVIKTRMQTNPELYDGSVAKAYRRIVRQEGHQFLWQGLGPTVVGYFFEGALKIGVYEAAKASGLVATLGSTWGFVAAGVLSGVVASVVLCPVEDLRIRMVAEPDFSREIECDAAMENCETQELGGLETAQKLIKEGGLWGAYSGFVPMLCKQVPYTVTKQCVFDWLTAAFYASFFVSGAAFAAGPLGCLLVSIGAAAVSAVLSCIASQPGDVLLTAAYKNGAAKPKLGDVLQEGGGIAALFVGTKARLLHVGFMNTIHLVAYDFIRVWLGMAASGRA